MICKKCGHQMADTNKFCEKCGTPAAATEAKKEPPKNPEKEAQQAPQQTPTQIVAPQAGATKPVAQPTPQLGMAPQPGVMPQKGMAPHPGVVSTKGMSAQTGVAPKATDKPKTTVAQPAQPVKSAPNPQPVVNPGAPGAQPDAQPAPAPAPKPAVTQPDVQPAPAPQPVAAQPQPAVQPQAQAAATVQPRQSKYPDEPKTISEFIGKSFEDMRQTKSWVGKVFLYALVLLVPILDFFVFGYLYGLAKHAAKKDGTPYPTDVFSSYNFKKGAGIALYTLIAYLICSIPTLIVAGQIINPIGILFSSMGWLFLISLALFFFMPMVLNPMCVRDVLISFGEGWNLGKIFKAMGKMFGKWILMFSLPTFLMVIATWIISFVLRMIAAQFVFIVPSSIISSGYASYAPGYYFFILLAAYASTFVVCGVSQIFIRAEGYFVRAYVPEWLAEAEAAQTQPVATAQQFAVPVAPVVPAGQQTVQGAPQPVAQQPVVPGSAPAPASTPAATQPGPAPAAAPVPQSAPTPVQHGQTPAPAPTPVQPGPAPVSAPAPAVPAAVPTPAPAATPTSAAAAAPAPAPKPAPAAPAPVSAETTPSPVPKPAPEQKPEAATTYSKVTLIYNPKEKYTFSIFPATIGQSGNATLCAKGAKGLDDIHCEINKNSAGEFTIEDRVSATGTFVNGNRIIKTTVIKTGDKINVGDITLTVELI